MKKILLFNIQTWPRQLLLVTALILLVFSFFNYYDSIDINLHDTYFVISYSALYRGMTLLLLLFWIVYIISDSLLPIIALRWLHVLIMIIALGAFVVATSSHIGISGPPRRYYALADFQRQMRWINFTGYLIIAATLSQLFFIANLVIGIVKKFTSAQAK